MQGKNSLFRIYGRRFIIAFCAAFILASLLTAIWGFFIEPAIITVTRLQASDPSLPEQWEGRRIVFFSDIHLGPSFDLDRLEKTAARISSLEPDLILFGGDIIDHRTPHDPEYIARAGRLLAAIQAPLGKYAVVGNHDNRLRAELQVARNILESGGFTVLVNQSIVIDDVLLIGLDETYFGNPDLDLALAERLDDAVREQPFWPLLLIHQPDFAARLPEDSARLILAGHSHNGQVTLFGRPIITVFQGEEYPYGHYQLNPGRQLIVTRGLGTVGPPARLFNPPEIMLITLGRRGDS